MARALILFLLVLVTTILLAVAESKIAATRSSPTNYIKISCKVTQYPTVCVQSLTAHANTIQRNPRQLAITALSVSQSRAKTIKTNINKMKYLRGLKPRERGAIKDCAEEMDDMVDRLGKSIQELKQMSGASGNNRRHISNAQTWTSAALTDASTCIDGFAGRAMDGKVKALVTVQVTGAIQFTSNALALVNRNALRHY